MHKKNQSTIAAISLIVLITIIVLVGSDYSPFSVFPSGYNYHTEAKLLNEDSNSVTYSFLYVTNGPSGDYPTCGDPKQFEIISFDPGSQPTSQSSLPAHVEGVQLNTEYLATFVNITPLLARSNYICNTQNINELFPIYTDLGTKCKVLREGEYSSVTCNFNGIINALDSQGNQIPAAFGWVNELYAEVKIFKEGFSPECTSSVQCSQGFICQNYECVVDNGGKSVYYRLAENACSEILLLPEEVTEDDYVSLNACELNIVESSQIIMLIGAILGGIVLMGGLSFFYLKVRRR